MILLIGPLSFGSGVGHPLLGEQGYRFACFEEVDADLLEATRPDMVVSALTGARFDAVDVVRRLAQLGYRGSYRALSTFLPRPDIVRAELRAAAPDLDVDVVMLSHGPDRPG